MSREYKPKVIKLCIRDLGAGGFEFKSEGDTEVWDDKSVPTGEYTPAEFIGAQLFGVCKDYLDRHGDLGPRQNDDAPVIISAGESKGE